MGRFLLKALKLLLISVPLLFIGTFAVYWFNLENKLIYYAVRPFLNRHYDSMQRDRRIV